MQRTVQEKRQHVGELTQHSLSHFFLLKAVQSQSTFNLICPQIKVLFPTFLLILKNACWGQAQLANFFCINYESTSDLKSIWWLRLLRGQSAVEERIESIYFHAKPYRIMFLYSLLEQCFGKPQKLRILGSCGVLMMSFIVSRQSNMLCTTVSVWCLYGLQNTTI